MLFLNFKLGPIFQEGPKNQKANLFGDCLSPQRVPLKQTNFAALVLIKENLSVQKWWLVGGILVGDLSAALFCSDWLPELALNRFDFLTDLRTPDSDKPSVLYPCCCFTPLTLFLNLCTSHDISQSFHRWHFRWFPVFHLSSHCFWHALTTSRFTLSGIWWWVLKSLSTCFEQNWHWNILDR